MKWNEQTSSEASTYFLFVSPKDEKLLDMTIYWYTCICIYWPNNDLLSVIYVLLQIFIKCQNAFFSWSGLFVIVKLSHHVTKICMRREKNGFTMFYVKHKHYISFLSFPPPKPRPLSNSTVEPDTKRQRLLWMSAPTTLCKCKRVTFWTVTISFVYNSACFLFVYIYICVNAFSPLYTRSPQL